MVREPVGALLHLRVAAAHAVRDETLARPEVVGGLFEEIREIEVHRQLLIATPDPGRAPQSGERVYRAGERDAGAQVALMSTCFGFDSCAFGMSIVSTPSLKLAAIRSASAFAGSEKLRENEP